jgi:hypothetical protein
MTPSTVVLEIKPGPYDPNTDKVFADWAPGEDEAGAGECLRWLKTTVIGDRWRPPSTAAKMNER